MTLSEALEELQIEPPCSPEEVRRCYLRLLKTRKPEIDPLGFRRLREAYELVFRFASSRAGKRPVPRPTWSEALPVAGGGGGAAGRRRAPVLDREQRLEALRREVWNRPREVRLRWRLISELSLAGRHEEVPQVLREGAAEGLHDFLRELARRFPHLLTAGEMERLVEEGTRDTLLSVVTEQLERGQAAVAAAVLTRLLDAPRDDGARGAEETVPPPPPPQLVLKVVLMLLGRQLLEAAAELFATYQEALRAAGGERKLLGNAVGTWVVTRELVQLPAAFPEKVRELMADAAVHGDLARADAALRDFARAEPAEAGLAASLLPSKSLLRKAFHADLAEPEPEEESEDGSEDEDDQGEAESGDGAESEDENASEDEDASRAEPEPGAVPTPAPAAAPAAVSTPVLHRALMTAWHKDSRWWRWFVFFLGAAVVSIVATLLEPHPSPSPAPAAPAAGESTAASSAESAAEPNAAPPSTLPLEDAITRLCETAEPSLPPIPCWRARLAHEALFLQAPPDCDSPRRTVQIFEELQAKTVPADISETPMTLMTRSLAAAVRARCGAVPHARPR